MNTRTGSFPIGFRRGGSPWQKDLPGLLAWAKDHDFSVLDLPRFQVDDVPAVAEAGFDLGSVDLLDWQLLFSPEKSKRAEGIETNERHIVNCARFGVRNFFLVVLPENPELPRAQNFEFAIESFQKLAPILERHAARLVIEGYPGPGALLCTPETVRRAFQECPSESIGLNYDPSHLIRMGIDPIRFLKEFVSRVYHVHGKDTEILADDLYEYGHEQPATFKADPPFGRAAWRYTIPGQGQTPWGEVFRILEGRGYEGAVSIELEDRDYNGSEEGEKAGLLASSQFLEAC